MNDPRSEPLSPAGLARREAMFDELVEVMTRTHRARRTRRRMLAIGGCTGLLLLLIRLSLPVASTPTKAPQIADGPPQRSTGNVIDNSPEHRACVTVLVQTDPAVVERYRARPTGRIVRMDDRMLLETLASIHRPAGLIRFGDRIRLSAAVTDAESGLKR